jgi:hypothetical protein
MMGILIRVPELRTELEKVTGGTEPDGDLLARITSDWVQGRPLAEMAVEYFSDVPDDDDEPSESDPVGAMTRCCRNVFGRLTQTASWGLAALQSLTFPDFDELSVEEQRAVRNLPARVYYGVNSEEALALRILGVPRTAAPALARRLGIQPAMPLNQTRALLRAASASVWNDALGSRGNSYHHVWSIIEGDI